MLAATNVTFAQKVIDTRARFLKLSERQLPFGQLPLLQIDGTIFALHSGVVYWQLTGLHGRHGNCAESGRSSVPCSSSKYWLVL
jgi:hypothetical protein